MTNGTNGAGPNGVTATIMRSQYRFMELAREKAQSGPSLPGAGGAYHVRTIPPSRSGTPPTAPPASTAAPPVAPAARPPSDSTNRCFRLISFRLIMAPVMRPSRRLFAMVGPLLALAFAKPAAATLVLALDLPALVARADQISVVDVVSVKTSWNPDHNRILDHRRFRGRRLLEGIGGAGVARRGRAAGRVARRPHHAGRGDAPVLAGRASAALSPLPAADAGPGDRRGDGPGQAPPATGRGDRPLDGERPRARGRRLRPHHAGLGRGVHGAGAAARRSADRGAGARDRRRRRRAMKRAQAGALVAAALALATPRPAAAFVRYVTEYNAPFFWAETTVAITGYPNDFNQSSMTPDQVAGAVAGAAAAWSSGQNACTYLRARDVDVGRPDPAGGQRRPQLAHLPQHRLVPHGRQGRLRHGLRRFGAGGHDRHGEQGDRRDPRLPTSRSTSLHLPMGRRGPDPDLDGDMDLQNALTHELGHLIGLDHTCYDSLTSSTAVRPDDNTGAPVVDCSSADAEVKATTMYPSATPGDIEKRTLAPDDQNAVCTIYSVNNPPPALDAGCVQCATAGDPTPGGLLAALAAIGLMLRRRRTGAARS